MSCAVHKQTNCNILIRTGGGGGYIQPRFAAPDRAEPDTSLNQKSLAAPDCHTISLVEPEIGRFRIRTGFGKCFSWPLEKVDLLSWIPS